MAAWNAWVVEQEAREAAALDALAATVAASWAASPGHATLAEPSLPS